MREDTEINWVQGLPAKMVHFFVPFFVEKKQAKVIKYWLSIGVEKFVTVIVAIAAKLAQG